MTAYCPAPDLSTAPPLGGWARIPHALVVALAQLRLDPSSRAVLDLVLAHQAAARADERQAVGLATSARLLASSLGLSSSAAGRALRRLAELGVLTYRPDDRWRGARRYSVAHPSAWTCDVQAQRLPRLDVEGWPAPLLGWDRPSAGPGCPQGAAPRPTTWDARAGASCRERDPDPQSTTTLKGVDGYWILWSSGGQRHRTTLVEAVASLVDLGSLETQLPGGWPDQVIDTIRRQLSSRTGSTWSPGGLRVALTRACERRAELLQLQREREQREGNAIADRWDRVRMMEPDPSIRGWLDEAAARARAGLSVELAILRAAVDGLEAPPETLQEPRAWVLRQEQLPADIPAEDLSGSVAGVPLDLPLGATDAGGLGDPSCSETVPGEAVAVEDGATLPDDPIDCLPGQRAARRTPPVDRDEQGPGLIYQLHPPRYRRNRTPSRIRADRDRHIDTDGGAVALGAAKVRHQAQPRMDLDINPAERRQLRATQGAAPPEEQERPVPHSSKREFPHRGEDRHELCSRERMRVDGTVIRLATGPAKLDTDRPIGADLDAPHARIERRNRVRVPPDRGWRGAILKLREELSESDINAGAGVSSSVGAQELDPEPPGGAIGADGGRRQVLQASENEGLLTAPLIEDGQEL